MSRYHSLTLGQVNLMQNILHWAMRRQEDPSALIGTLSGDNETEFMSIGERSQVYAYSAGISAEDKGPELQEVKLYVLDAPSQKLMHIQACCGQCYYVAGSLFIKSVVTCPITQARQPKIWQYYLTAEMLEHLKTCYD